MQQLHNNFNTCVSQLMLVLVPLVLRLRLLTPMCDERVHEFAYAKTNAHVAVQATGKKAQVQNIRLRWMSMYCLLIQQLMCMP